MNEYTPIRHQAVGAFSPKPDAKQPGQSPAVDAKPQAPKVKRSRKVKRNRKALVKASPATQSPEPAEPQPV